MFVVLGLLSYPSRLIDVAPQALLISAVLILVARPLAVVGVRVRRLARQIHGRRHAGLFRCAAGPAGPR